MSRTSTDKRRMTGGSLRGGDAADRPGDQWETQRGVRLTGVGKTYAQSGRPPKAVLSGLDLHIRSGEFFSMLGPSGCGKTTALRIMAGLLEATAGEVLIDGDAVRGPREDVGIVFQSPTLVPWKTVRENCLLPARLARVAAMGEVEERVEDLLRMVGLQHAGQQRPAELSGGMQQRVAIVRALSTDPAILLMDEPFSAVDEFTRELLNDELLRLWQLKEKTVVFVTHSISEAVYLSDRIGVMVTDPARVKEIVSIDLARPRNEQTRAADEYFSYVSGVRTHLFDNSRATGHLGGRSPGVGAS